MSINNHLHKYKKYNEKLNNLLYQIGGNIKIIHENNIAFLTNWIKIINNGQQNCGIYLSTEDAQKNKIIKCTNGEPKEKIINLYKRTIDYHIFPHIYELHTYKYLDDYKKPQIDTYTIMEKIDGDLGDLLLKFIPETIQKKHKFNEIILDLFILKTSYRIYNKYLDNTDTNPIYIGSLMNTYHNNSICVTINKDFRELIFYNFKGENDNNWLKNINQKISEFDGYKIDDSQVYINNEKNDLEKSDNLINLNYIKFMTYLKKFDIAGIALDDYIMFFNLVKNEINNILPAIQKIIQILLEKLYSIKLQYIDFKFDNFGYKFVDAENSNTIRFNDKIIELYILDIESGLKEFDINIPPVKINYKEFNIYGGYNLKNIHKYIFNTSNYNFLKYCLITYGFSENLLQIFDYTNNIIDD